MVRLESLKKSNQFKKCLNKKNFIQIISHFLLLKIFTNQKNKSDLLISFVMKKKKLVTLLKETELEEN